jgi:hypothetical protein
LVLWVHWSSACLSHPLCLPLVSLRNCAHVGCKTPCRYFVVTTHLVFIALSYVHGLLVPLYFQTCFLFSAFD